MDILIYILITFWQQCFLFLENWRSYLNIAIFCCMPVRIAFTCLSIKRIFITINRIVTILLREILAQIFIAPKMRFSIYQRFNVEFLQISNFIEIKFQSKFLFFFLQIYSLNFISISALFSSCFFDYTHYTHNTSCVISHSIVINHVPE